MMDYAKSYKWIKGYRCPCGKLMLNEEEGYHGLVYSGVHDVCPLCGAFANKYEVGSIQLEYYFVREKLWGIFPYMQKKRKIVTFIPAPAEDGEN